MAPPPESMSRMSSVMKAALQSPAFTEFLRNQGTPGPSTPSNVGTPGPTTTSTTRSLSPDSNIEPSLRSYGHEVGIRPSSEPDASLSTATVSQPHPIVGEKRPRTTPPSIQGIPNGDENIFASQSRPTFGGKQPRVSLARSSNSTSDDDTNAYGSEDEEDARERKIQLAGQLAAKLDLPQHLVQEAKNFAEVSNSICLYSFHKLSNNLQLCR